MPSLRLTAPGQPPTVYHLHKKITSLGSGPDNDIVLPDPLVQDGYAVHFDGQTYTVFAPKKTEFVVNGKKRSKHKLSHDERLTIGSVELKFAMVDDAPPVEAEAANTIADLDAYTKLYEFSDRLMDVRDLTELLDALMDAVIEHHQRRQGLPDPARGRDARRQGRAQPQAREHRRRRQPALRLDHREGGSRAQAGDRLRRAARRRVRGSEERDAPQAVDR